MKMVKVRLSRAWSGHEAGKILSLESGKAKRICAKGFGEILKGKQAETAMVTPQAEKAVEFPEGYPQTPTPSEES